MTKTKTKTTTKKDNEKKFREHPKRAPCLSVHDKNATSPMHASSVHASKVPASHNGPRNL